MVLLGRMWMAIFSLKRYLGKKKSKWHRLIIHFALQLMNTSKKALEQVRAVIPLPSDSTLKRYRHFTNIHEGWDTALSAFSAALQSNKTESDPRKIGVLACDETKVSEGLVFNTSSGELIGFISYDIDSTKNSVMAKYVLQFSWRSLLNSYTFPLAYFATCGLEGPVLWHWVVNGLIGLAMLGVWPVAVVCDGLAANRSFIRETLQGNIIDNPDIDTKFINPVNHLPT